MTDSFAPRTGTAALGDGRQPFALGVFGANAQRGLITSNVPGTLDLTWSNTDSIARQADELGWELLLPFARWRGYGGTQDMNATVYETFTWAAALAARTRQITVSATVHASAIHPVVAAKMATTVDHASDGRFAVNLVMGWFPHEQAMFGTEALPHDTRYQYGEEWLDIVRKLWTETEPFDYRGDHFSITAGQAQPKPLGGRSPAVINAGASPAGISFSARHADINFCSIMDPEAAATQVEHISTLAAEAGRSIDVMTYGTVFCADTEAEARAKYDEVLEHADWETANIVMDLIGINSGSYSEQLARVRERFITSGGGFPLVGTPDQITETLVAIRDSGIKGMVFGFVDHAKEMQYFGERVMPRLVDAGLRV